MADEPAPRFYAFACDEGRSHAHLIPGASDHQDAALSFADHWIGEPADEVAIAVLDAHSGEERRFRIWLEPGAC